MSYKAGIGPGLAEFGLTPCDPRHICDGCGASRPIESPTANYQMPPKWFRDGKPPPGWRGVRAHDGSKRWDLCPDCWRAPNVMFEISPSDEDEP